MVKHLKKVLPDLLIWTIGLVSGLAVAHYLHYMWFYGGWMELFAVEGTPAMDPAYENVCPLFYAAPYVAAGLVAGLVLGFGTIRLSMVLLRATGLLVLGLILFTRNSSLACTAFVPTAVGAFTAMTTLVTIHAYLRKKLTKEEV
jgi:hypothetical protein